MRWHHRISSMVSLWSTKKINHVERRVRLRLEELETRALLSASSVPAATSLLSNVTAQTNSSTITPAANLTFSGYTPQQLQTAYGVPASVNGQPPGTGETIAIVDAYNDPNIAKDLATFDAKYGLPTANLTVVNQNGSSTNLPANDPGWAVEESLDVEWAHAIAPGAKIVLVEANSSSLSNLLTAVSTATSKEGANVVSMSWGANEFSSETNYDKYFTAPAVTYVASAGDSGAFFGPEWPASSPNVLAVGGSTLNLTSSNTISNESAWSASFSRYYGLEGGGGGISSYETAPSYQSNIPAAQQNNARTTPDVSWDANPGTGVSVYDSYDEPGWGYVGGTSAGAPAWAGIVAIADQQAGGSLSTNKVESTLYQAYSGMVGTGYANYFNDITRGSNGYQAGTGYDLATGLGSPKVGALVSLLANPTSTASGASRSTTSGTTGGTTTHSTQHHTANNPVDSRGVVEGNGAASSASDASTINVSVSVMSLPTLVPSSVSAGNSTSIGNNASFIPLLSATPSLSPTGSASVAAGSVNAFLPQNASVFGASGWNGSALSWRMGSLDLPGQSVEPMAGDLPEEGQDDLAVPSAGDAIVGNADVFGEDLSILDVTAPPLLDGEVGDGCDGGDGASGE